MTENQSLRRGYALLGFFTLLNIINFVDRNLIIGFSNQIVEDLELSEVQYGLLTGLVFTIFYTTVGIFLGMMADRYNRPRLIAVGLFIWSLMTVLSGAAKNFAHMGAARLFVGAGEATLTPTALSLLSDVLPPSKRAMASGVYYMGVPVGTGAGLIMAGVLGPQVGWRNSFYIMGVIGVVLTGVVLLVKDPPRGAMEETSEDSSEKAVEAHASFSAVLADLFAALKSSPALVWVMTGAVVAHIGLAATLFDIRWLVAERGFTVTTAPLYVGGIYTIAGALAVGFGGALADACHKRWDGGKLRFLVACQVIAIPFGVAYRFVEPQTAVFYICLFIGSMSATLFYGPVFSAVQDLSPIRVRATAVAFLLFAVNMIGIGGGGVATGVLIAMFRERGMEEPMTYGIFAVALVSMTSSVFYLLAALKYKESLARLET